VRRALQQPDAERALERLQAAAYRGLRRSHLGCGGRQIARFDYTHERFHQLETLARALGETFRRSGAGALGGEMAAFFGHTYSV